MLNQEIIELTENEMKSIVGSRRRGGININIAPQIIVAPNIQTNTGFIIVAGNNFSGSLQAMLGQLNL